jgi:hypothetical protein
MKGAPHRTSKASDTNKQTVSVPTPEPEPEPASTSFSVQTEPPPSMVEAPLVVREASPVTTSSSSSSSPNHPVEATPIVPEYSLSARLELAASHPDILEALVALETWSRLVGPETASKDFFECQALEILLQNFIVNPTLIQTQQVKDVLVSLFMHVFTSPDSDTGMSASIFVLSLEEFLSKLSQLHLLQISSEKSSPLAIRLSDSLRAVHAIFLNERNRLEDKGSQHAMESDIVIRKKQVTQLCKKITGNDDGCDDVIGVESSGTNIRDILELSDVTQDLLNLQLQVI